MKVLLINVCLRPNSPKLIFPIGLGYIATAIDRAGFDLEILDIDAYRYSEKKVKKLLRTKKYDVAALGCIITGYRVVKQLAEIIKEHKNIPVIAGNSVASSIPELLLRKTKVDIAVIGEGDVTIVELLKAMDENKPLDSIDGIYYKHGDKIIPTKPRVPVHNIDDIPHINWDLFDMDIYISKSKYIADEPYRMEFNKIKAMPVNTARGCAYKCTFCYHVFINNRYRVRSPGSICNEIKLLKSKYGINHVSFWDELTFYSKKQCSEFVDAMLESNLQVYWMAICRADLFNENDVDLLLKCKKAGCIGLGYSLESADRRILKAMNKKMTIEEFTVQAKACKKAGIASYTSLVVGYPQETEESIRKTFNCCYDNEIYPSVGYLLPQPGTPMYDYAIKNGLVENEEEYLLSIGDRQEFQINFTQMEQSKMESLVKGHLKRISEKLNINLKEDNLIKTGHYRAKTRKEYKK